MYRVAEQPSIDVIVPHPQVEGPQSSPIALQTQLFRGVGLGQALSYVYERNQPGEGLRVAFAGCSIGAEADSFMSLHNGSGFGGEVEAFGFDINPAAIRHARRGKYFLPVPPPYPRQERELQELEAALINGGFRVDMSTVQALTIEEFTPDPSSYEPEDAECYIVDASTVREPHSVSFEEHDLVYAPPTIDSVSLGLVNNVLYHLHPDQATRFIWHVAELLADNGVLSIGGLHNARFRNMGTPDNYSDVRFRTWLDETIAQLEKEFNLTPKTFGEPAIVLAKN